MTLFSNRAIFIIIADGAYYYYMLYVFDFVRTCDGQDQYNDINMVLRKTKSKSKTLTRSAYYH